MSIFKAKTVGRQIGGMPVDKNYMDRVRKRARLLEKVTEGKTERLPLIEFAKQCRI